MHPDMSNDEDFSVQEAILILENNILERVSHQGNRLRDLYDQQVKVLHEIDKTLTRNTDNLELHMKRTSNLEGRIFVMETHIIEAKGVGKFFRLLAWVIGVLISVFTALKTLNITFK